MLTINLITILRQILAYGFLIVGTYFFISTAVGIIRFPDLYTRLHAGSKCLMAGSISALLGCTVLEGISYTSLKLIVIIFLLIFTNPVAIHVIANFANNYNIIPKTVTEKHITE